MDPIASLRLCAVDVELDGWLYTIPPLPAAAWIEAVLDVSGTAVVPGLMEHPQDRRSVIRAWMVGSLTSEQIQDAARTVLGAASGWDWWTADRIIRASTYPETWPMISGEMTRRGIDLGRISIGAYCNFVWAHALGNCEKEQDRMAFKWEMTRPPGDVDDDELYDEQAEATSFERDMANM